MLVLLVKLINSQELHLTVSTSREKFINSIFMWLSSNKETKFKRIKINVINV